MQRIGIKTEELGGGKAQVNKGFFFLASHPVLCDYQGGDAVGGFSVDIR